MKSFILSIVLILATARLSPAQVTNAPVTDTNVVAANLTPVNQAPEDVVKKLSGLVHDEKYAEAQQLTSGLLLAYPDDQRLIKAKVLLEKLITAQSPTTTPNVSQPAAKTLSGQLTGMDKVEYNSLIEMAREAQQNTDLDQQKVSLKQFMDESGTFLKKFPDQMQLWEFRIAAALILDDPDAGYDAGQKLLAAGGADSNDPSIQQLIAKLKIKGWLDKQKVEDYKKYGWILGTWSKSVSWIVPEYQIGKEIFSKTDSGNIEGHNATIDGRESPRPNMQGTILASGEIRWEQYLQKISSVDGKDVDPEDPEGNYFIVNDHPGKPIYPSGWQPPSSYTLSDDKRTITMVFPEQSPAPKKDRVHILQHPVTLVFVKISDSQGQSQPSMHTPSQSQQDQPQQASPSSRAKPKAKP